MNPRASILIPTWSAHTSLGAAIGSALAQTVTDLEVLVVADGATADTLAVARDHADRDPRVKVLELPKAPARGERNRHRGVLAAATDAIVYLADDDLLLPRHVENVLAALETHDFVQTWNGYIDHLGVLRLLPADLADPAWRTWHLSDPPQNRVSITGTAHTVGAYRRLPEGWVVPEPGMPADLTLWRQFFRLPDLRAVTLWEMTTLQFPAPARRGLDDAAIVAQRAPWEALLARPDAHEELQRLAAEATRRELLELSAFSYRLLADVPILTEQRDRAQAELDAHRASRWWRLTAPVRALRTLGRDRPARSWNDS